MKPHSKVLPLLIICLFLFSYINISRVRGIAGFPDVIEVGIEKGDKAVAKSVIGWDLNKTDYNGLHEMTVTEVSNQSETSIMMVECSKVVTTEEYTDVYINIYTPTSIIPIFDYSEESMAQNWRAVAFGEVKFVIGDWYSLMQNFLYPNNIPLSSIYSKVNLETLNGTLATINQIPYTRYWASVNDYTIGDGIPEFNSISCSATSTPVGINKVETTTDIAFNFNMTEPETFDGKIHAERYFEVTEDGFPNNIMLNFDINYTADRITWSQEIFGTITQTITLLDSQKASIDWLNEYWYLWLALVLGGGFVLYFFTLRSQCKMEKAPKQNWSCRVGKQKQGKF